MNRRLFVLLVLAALVSPAIARLARAQNQIVTLSDGTVITLQGVTYGKERQFGNWTISPQFGVSTTVPDTRDAIILWVKGVRPAAGPTARMGLQTGAVRIYDETGKEFPSCEQYVETHYLPDNGHAIVLYSWPRRTGEIDVAIGYDMRAAKADAIHFRVQNRLISKAPPFTPHALPITRRDADLSVTLDAIRQAPPIGAWSGPQERLERLTRGQKLLTNTTFRYEFRGQRSTDWMPTDAMVEDSTGNPYRSAASSIYQPGRTAISYYRSDTGEPVKMGVWFNRTSNANFAQQETIAMNNLPMKLGSYLYVPGAAGRADKISIEISRIGEVESAGMRTTITLSVFGGDPHLSLLMRVQNQDGRFAHGIGPNEKSQWIAGSTRPPDRFSDDEKANAGPHQCVDFALDLPRGTTRINCTAAVNKAHYFEFIPKPEAVQ